jgi:FkbM family methyltransferase
MSNPELVSEESRAAAGELEGLLTESREDAANRAASQFALRQGDALVLYGAGNLGREVLAKLRSEGVDPVAFADDTIAKQGQMIDGLKVVRPQDVSSEFGAHAVFAVTIFNPAASFRRISRRLQQQTGARVVSFLSLAWQYPDTFLPHYQFELPQDVLENADDIRRAFQVFADEESRRQFVSQVRLRLHLDYDALPRSSEGDYFPAGVLPKFPSRTTFIDCGAFDGDTIKRFLTHQQGCFHKIFAFEPDEQNCRKLRDYVASLATDVASRIHVYNAGVGSRRTKMKFNQAGNTSASLSDAGNVEVEVVPIQEIVEGDDATTVYIKFDVEGAEWEALKGAEELIRRAPPVLAVSIYHQPDDLWQLPLYLKSLNPRYSLFLRTQGEDGMDVVCYAVPGSQT